MTEADELGIAVKIISGTECDLRHHDDEKHLAVNTIVVPMGYKEPDGTYIQKDELVIYICEDCVRKLQSIDWSLMYCFNCCSSQWIYLPLAKRSKEHYNNINWITYCPKCFDKEKATWKT